MDDRKLKQNLLGETISEPISFEKFLETVKALPDNYYGYCQNCHNSFYIGKRGTGEAGYYLQHGCVVCSDICVVLKKFVTL